MITVSHYLNILLCIEFFLRYQYLCLLLFLITCSISSCIYHIGNMISICPMVPSTSVFGICDHVMFSVISNGNGNISPFYAKVGILCLLRLLLNHCMHIFKTRLLFTTVIMLMHEFHVVVRFCWAICEAFQIKFRCVPLVMSYNTTYPSFPRIVLVNVWGFFLSQS